ncbi:MAG: radical SAM protein [Elusimicrobia bacterium]|nr:radical SAM protein [Elusimicrobiota bacterium]
MLATALPRETAWLIRCVETAVSRSIYSRLKLFHFDGRLSAIAGGTASAPVHVRIKPINACNDDCWYCAYRSESLDLGNLMRLRDRLPDEKMAELARDLPAMGVRAVTFTGGGEPLLHPALPATIESLARGGVKTAALTNGAFLKDDAARALKRHGTWVRVSMDSWDDASHTESRGAKPGEFTTILSNMADFAALGGDCELGVSFIVSRRNAARIYDACRLVKEAGARHVKLSACIVGNSGAENNAYHRPILEEVRAQIERCRVLEDASFGLVDHYHEMDDRFEKSYRVCRFLEFLTVIGADGGVYACQDKAYTESGFLGSIKDRSFRELWYSAECRDRRAAIDPSRVCSHHCVAHAKNLLIEEYLSIDAEHGAFV